MTYQVIGVTYCSTHDGRVLSHFRGFDDIGESGESLLDDAVIGRQHHVIN
ncbi:hypothetical protein THF1C08_210052 [Vibrio jasicida]|nr:hypothetical protein THF1C08_210052 [Vibrio jasicida]